MLAGGTGTVLTVVAGGVLVIGGLNLVLGLLSLLPGLPLDGGRVVRAIAWSRTHDRDRAGRITARTGRLLGWSTVGIGVALAFMDRVTEGLLVLCLGWLLATGARSLDRRLALEGLLRGMRVEAAMRTDPPQVAPNLTIDTFASSFEGEAGVPAIPVVDDERVLGIIGTERLQRLGRRRFAATRAADVMATPPEVPFLAPGDDLWDAVDLMNQLGLEGLAVVDDGRLVGMVTRDSVGEVIRYAHRRRGAATKGDRPGMSETLLSVEAAQATVLAGVDPIADTEDVTPGGGAGPRGSPRTSPPPTALAAVGQLGDGRLRDPRGGRGRRHGDGCPVRLTVVGEVRAGAAPMSASQAGRRPDRDRGADAARRGRRGAGRADDPRGCRRRHRATRSRRHRADPGGVPGPRGRRGERGPPCGLRRLGGGAARPGRTPVSAGRCGARGRARDGPRCRSGVDHRRGPCDRRRGAHAGRTARRRPGSPMRTGPGLRALVRESGGEPSISGSRRTAWTTSASASSVALPKPTRSSSVGRRLGRAVRRRQAGVRGRRARRPVAGRGSAGQAIRLRARPATGRPGGSPCSSSACRATPCRRS